MALGKPAIPTPNKLDLRVMQGSVAAARQRIEQHVATLLQRVHHRALRRAIEIAEHLGIFQQVATVAQATELLMGDEVIVLAIHLAGPRRARGDRDRHCDVGIGSKQPARQRGLAGARRRRHHEQQATAGNDGHGLFFTRCSGPAHAVGR